jgi:hypothetical protein
MEFVMYRNTYTFLLLILSMKIVYAPPQRLNNGMSSRDTDLSVDGKAHNWLDQYTADVIKEPKSYNPVVQNPKVKVPDVQVKKQPIKRDILRIHNWLDLPSRTLRKGTVLLFNSEAEITDETEIEADLTGCVEYVVEADHFYKHPSYQKKEGDVLLRKTTLALKNSVTFFGRTVVVIEQWKKYNNIMPLSDAVMYILDFEQYVYYTPAQVLLGAAWAAILYQLYNLIV